MENKRIYLRPWKESDAAILYKYASDPDLGPRAGWPPHRNEEESLAAIRTFFNNDHTWAVVLKETGEPIGCAGFHLYNESNLKIEPDDCEIGYWIAKPYWNQGICTEAVNLIIDYCFNGKYFKAVWGSHFTSNPASGRVMEKCGFKDTGERVTCPKLLVGSDQEVRVLKIERQKQLFL